MAKEGMMLLLLLPQPQPRLWVPLAQGPQGRVQVAQGPKVPV